MGVARANPLQGELEYLGRGVSYCATCDGMFYRGKPIVVAGNAPDLKEETDYLRGIGCLVTEARLPGMAILGDGKVTGVRTAQGGRSPVKGYSSCGTPWPPPRLLLGWSWRETTFK